MILVLRLQDGLAVVELCIADIEDKVAGAGKRIIGQTVDCEVAGRVQNRLRQTAVRPPSVRTLSQAVMAL